MVLAAACPCGEENQKNFKTVKGMTKRYLQLGQLRRHSIRNYIVMWRTSDGQQSSSLLLARLQTANEKKKTKKKCWRRRTIVEDEEEELLKKEKRKKKKEKIGIIFVRNTWLIPILCWHLFSMSFRLSFKRYFHNIPTVAFGPTQVFNNASVALGCPSLCRTAWHM